MKVESKHNKIKTTYQTYASLQYSIKAFNPEEKNPKPIVPQYIFFVQAKRVQQCLKYMYFDNGKDI